CALPRAPRCSGCTLFFPLHALTAHVPRLLANRYPWNPGLSRRDEQPAPAVTTRAGAAPPPPTAVAAPHTAVAIPPVAVPAAPNPVTGLRLAHTIVVDPGHGGIDPGNPGLHFPGGLTEKDITLGVGKLLRAELLRRGLTVVLTRSTDTLIDLASRPTFCRADCDLFVSIHVNSMPAGRRQTSVTWVEPYVLSDAKTEDQKRVAQMENEAMRFGTSP